MNPGERSVESSDDIVREILVRLPPKSIFRCMCVMKRWKSLIMDHLFIKSFNSERKNGSLSYFHGPNLLGFVQCNTKLQFNGFRSFMYPWISRHSFLSVGEEGRGFDFRPTELGYFLSASNGLILCGCIPTIYHVIHPFTNRWVSLPSPPQRPPSEFTARAIGFACNESDCNDYKVVVTSNNRFEGGTDYKMSLQIYSSVEGRWMEAQLSAPHPFRMDRFKPPTVIGGIFHWITVKPEIIVHDSSSLLEGRNVKAQILQIPLPCLTLAVWRTDNGDTLWVSSSNKNEMKILRLSMGQYTHRRNRTIYPHDWELVHTVSMYTLRSLIGVTEEEKQREIHHVTRLRPFGIERDSLFWDRNFLHMVGFIPGHRPRICGRLRDKIFVYDYERRTIRPIELIGVPYFTDEWWDWYPYYESVSLDSYFTFGLHLSGRNTSSTSTSTSTSTSIHKPTQGKGKGKMYIEE